MIFVKLLKLRIIRKEMKARVFTALWMKGLDDSKKILFNSSNII